MASGTEVLQGKLTVSELMARDMVTVPLGTPLAKVVRLLAKCHSRHVLVTDAEGSLVGVVSDREVLRHVVPEEAEESAPLKSGTVESVMLTKFVSSTPEADPNDVAAVLVDGDVQCLPILERGRLVGLMTSDDLLLSWNRLQPVLQQANADYLTGLASRATFDRRLGEELERAHRGGTSLSLVLLDVDRFKKINDTCGHLTGDAILRMVGGCLGRHLRKYDVLARVGGDEFAAICPECGAAEIEAPIQRVQEAIRNMSVMVEGQRHQITLSIGAAVVDERCQEITLQQLYRAADECLYRAKRGGRDRAEITWLGDVDRDPKPFCTDEKSDCVLATGG